MIRWHVFLLLVQTAAMFSLVGSSDSNNNFGSRDRKHIIPTKVLIGYASHNYENVRKAVIQDGVNIVVWAFMEIVAVPSNEDVDARAGDNVLTIGDFDKPLSLSRHRSVLSNNDSIRSTNGDKQLLQQQPTFGSIKTSLDLEIIKQLINDLDANGYSHVLHLVSFGGWNGPHLDPSLDAREWYSVWKHSIASNIFHGIDWDLEGNDNLSSPNNVFTIDCLEKMGEISRLMKNDDYVVTMAPPRSYLNFNSSNFSRFVNLTLHDDKWHSDVECFGSNVYAYLLAKYGDCCIDLVSIQLYESFSYRHDHDGMTAGDCLFDFVESLAIQNQSFSVEFSQDPSLNMISQLVKMPLSKLVIGLANGWAINSSVQNNKTIYISAAECEEAYLRLKVSELGDLTPRGFMFWTIEERGTGGVYLARGIGKFLHGN